jgi:hypothetical protein
MLKNCARLFSRQAHDSSITGSGLTEASVAESSVVLPPFRRERIMDQRDTGIDWLFVSGITFFVSSTVAFAAIAFYVLTRPL